jgi:ABC-type lipoprotein release transport system permease subunit
MVVTEAMLQGVLSLALGVALAAVILTALGTVDLTKVSSADMMGVRMPSAVLLRLNWNSVVGAAVTAMSTVVVGSLVPAVRASRLKPVEATRFV